MKLGFISLNLCLLSKPVEVLYTKTITMHVIKNTIQRRIFLRIKLKLKDHHGLQSDEEQEELKVEPETRRNIPGDKK